MTSKLIFAFVAFFFFCTSVAAQEILPVDTSVRYIYSDTYFGQRLYRYEKDTAVEARINAIWKAAGLKQPLPFTLVSSNVTSVAVVVTPKERYLLYGSFYFWANESDAARQYLVLAHAIGLLAGNHDLKQQKRIFQCVAADEWAGFALFGLQNAGIGLTKEGLLEAIKSEPFKGAEVPIEIRLRGFEKGWITADGLSNAQKSAGFFLNEANLDDLPLPRYWMDGTPAIYQDNQNKFRQAFTPARTPTWGKADDLLRKALSKAGFQQWSYYCVNNGFAIITQTEQFDPKSTGAKPVSGDYRWRDTPPEENISSLLEYLKGFLWPRDGSFRFFVFVVTNQPIPKGRSDIKFDPSKVDELMRRGTSGLTPEMAAMPFTATHKVTVIVYEMTVSENTKQGSERVPPIFQPGQHIKGAGILSNIR